MSAPVARSKKSKIVEQPEVILQAAVPRTEDEDRESPMTRLTAIPIDPENIPTGMKTQSMLEKEKIQNEIDRRNQLAREKEQYNKMYKLIALGGSIAVGAIVAYKAAGYFNPSEIVDNAMDEIVDKQQ